jgi:beta-phosphoglucomutase-like phosphatase (HAD superfamily)
VRVLNILKESLVYQVVFDIDGTLVQSYDIDSHCYVEAVKDVTGIAINSDWTSYQHVTDAGILQEVISKHRLADKLVIFKEVKQAFLEKLTARIALNSINQVGSCSAFLSYLKTRHDVVVSFATGGWYESAILKLASAGIDHSSILIASANDEISRNAIMIKAMKDYQGVVNKCSYFGDGHWDKLACQQLGINFIAVGNRVEHYQSVKDFSNYTQLMKYIGL